VKKTLAMIMMIPFALAGGIFYGLLAHKLVRDREPCFTLLMLCGLASTAATVSWLSEASFHLAVWSFIGAGAIYILLRCSFGKGSALEMFFAPHLFVVLFLLLWPSLERARERARQHQRPNHSVERTGASRSSHLQFLCQWRLAPAATDSRR
jgi:NADH:ubiquinone oxidoreductase subunit 6 (subunit J)